MTLLIFKKKRLVESLEELFGGSDLPYDLFKAQTVLSIHGGYLDKADTFLDSSWNNFNITRAGAVFQGLFSPFIDRCGSAYFPGAGAYLQSDITGKEAGTGSVTYECFLYQTNIREGVILNSRSAVTRDGIDIQISNSGKLFCTYSNVGLYSGTAELQKNRWYHIAVVRNGSSEWSVYINGVRDGGFSNNLNITSNKFFIGYTVHLAPFIGYIASCRVTNAPVYTSNFAVPTAPLTAGANTVLLLNFENAGVVDAARHNNLETVGNIRVSSVQKKFGNTSIYFDGGSWIHLPANANFEPVDKDFTVEWWWYPTNVSIRQWFFHTETDYWLGVDFQPQEGFGLGMWASSSGTNWNLISSDPAGNGRSSAHPALNAWNHIAYTRSGDTFSLYLNGVLVKSVKGITAAIVNRASQKKVIGSWAIAQHLYPLYGYLDDFRVTIGKARYQTNFTPRQYLQHADVEPASFDPYWDKVSLRMPSVIDGSVADKCGHAITKVGNAVPKTTLNAYGSAPAYMQVSSYLTIAQKASEFVFGSGDFTIELWVNRETVSAGHYLIDFRPASANGLYPTLHINASNKLAFWTSAATFALHSTRSIQPNTWHHIAISRASGTTRMFIDGTFENAISDANNYTCGANRPAIGVDGYTTSSEYANAYIDDLRITKGLARYTRDFKVPARALPVNDYLGYEYDPYYNQTVLMMPMDTLNDLKGKATTKVGNPVVSTETYKNAASLYLDGSSYLTLENSTVFALGSSEFTIEFWMYSSVPWTSQQASAGLISFGTTSGTNGWSLYRDGNYPAKLNLRIAGQAYITSGRSVPTQQWVHVCVCRSNGTIRLYLDGVVEAQVTTDATVWQTGEKLVIGHSPWGGSFEGFIEDLRITKDKARYVANFVPPTKSLPTVNIT